MLAWYCRCEPCGVGLIADRPDVTEPIADVLVDKGGKAVVAALP
jgi:hypothetical protein